MSDSTETNSCDRCGDEYERYIVLIQDDFVSISNYVSSEYDDLCKPCRAHLHPRQAFTGAGEVDGRSDERPSVCNDSDERDREVTPKEDHE